MGAAKHGSKGTGGGGYVEGFFHLFGWKVKAGKKLLSSKSDLPQQSKQVKKGDANLSMTRIQLKDECEIKAGSSIEGSSANSRASSVVTDDEGYGTKVPGVVARMMGLDSLPASSLAEPYSTTLHTSQSHQHFYHLQNHDTHQPLRSGNSLNKGEAPASSTMESKPQKKSIRPIKKFQTEVLPPKSAKSLPVTQGRKFSPINFPGAVPTKNAAHVTKAAAKIIQKEPQTTARKKVRDPKEKLEASIKPVRPAQNSCRPIESSAARYLKGQSLNKSWNGSVETSARVRSHAEENSAAPKHRGKSISLAVQAKANVQRREHKNPNCSSLIGQRGQDGVNINPSFNSQSNIQKSTRKSSIPNIATGVFKQNNEKQNCLNKDALSTKPSVSNLKGRKKASDESSLGRNKNLSKSSANLRSGSRKLGVEVTNSERGVPYSEAKNVPRKRRSIDGDFHWQKHCLAGNATENNSGKPVQRITRTDIRCTWAEESRNKGPDVVSFIFTAPMTRSTTGSESSSPVADRCNGIDSNCHSEKWLADSDATKLSSVGKLELTSGIESSHCNLKVHQSTSPASILPYSLPCHSCSHAKRGYDGLHADELRGQFDSNFSSIETPAHGASEKYQGVEETDESSGDPIVARHPSPVSVLEPFPTESCNSLGSTESCSTEGSSRQCSSIQTQKGVSWGSSKKFQSAGNDAELSDSASSTSTETFAILNKEVGTMVEDYPRSSKWELNYVKEILCNVEKGFKDFALGRAREIMTPHLFYQLESRKRGLKTCGGESRIGRRAIFDCVNECLQLRCQRSVGGGVLYVGVKGVAMMTRKQWLLDLAGEVYKEICGWGGMGDCMVDELVDKDMSSQQGRWLDFEVEAGVVGAKIEDQLLNYLVDEVVADISQS